VKLDLSGAEILEDVAVRSLAETCSDSFRHFDAAADGDKVNVLGVAVEKQVTHISAHHIAGAMKGVGDSANIVEYGSF
jgi:hypothetical protein